MRMKRKETAKTMLELTISIEGHRQDDLAFALEVVLEQVKEGYLAGSGGNETGRYSFDVSGEEEEDEEFHCCCVCGKPAEGTEDTCECVCPVCGQNCFDDQTIADHGRCYDCHQEVLLADAQEGEGEGEDD